MRSMRHTRSFHSGGGLHSRSEPQPVLEVSARHQRVDDAALPDTAGLCCVLVAVACRRSRQQSTVCHNLMTAVDIYTAGWQETKTQCEDSEAT